MARYVVLPKHETIVKCRKCGTLYVPDSTHMSWHTFEDCPHCGYYGNKKKDAIPLWKYNMIKWFRGGFKNETN